MRTVYVLFHNSKPVRNFMTMTEAWLFAFEVYGGDGCIVEPHAEKVYTRKDLSEIDAIMDREDAALMKIRR